RNPAAAAAGGRLLPSRDSRARAERVCPGGSASVLLERASAAGEEVPADPSPAEEQDESGGSRSRQRPDDAVEAEGIRPRGVQDPPRDPEREDPRETGERDRAHGHRPVEPDR